MSEILSPIYCIFAEIGCQSGSENTENGIQEFDIIRLLPGTIRPVMIMKYEDANMDAYWNTLSPQVQAWIEATGIELCSLGMLMKLGDYQRSFCRQWS